MRPTVQLVMVNNFVVKASHESVLAFDLPAPSSCVVKGSHESVLAFDVTAPASKCVLMHVCST